MNIFNNKLSKGVLGMKFMRRTKEQVDKDKTESTFRKHYSPAAASTTKKHQEHQDSPLKREASPPPLPIEPCVVEEVRSYSQCEGHIFGRQSYGGFNPLLEANVRKGIWRPFHLEPQQRDEEEFDADDKRQSDDGEMDISDEEMAEHKAKTYGSLVGTLGKRFMRKRQKEGAKDQHQEKGAKEQKGRKEVAKGRKDQEKGRNEGAKGKKGWKQFFGGKKDKKNVQGGTDGKKNKKPIKNEPGTSDEPPTKKRKFMKPKD